MGCGGSGPGRVNGKKRRGGSMYKGEGPEAAGKRQDGPIGGVRKVRTCGKRLNRRVRKTNGFNSKGRAGAQDTASAVGPYTPQRRGKESSRMYSPSRSSQQ